MSLQQLSEAFRAECEITAFLRESVVLGTLSSLSLMFINSTLRN